MKLSSPFISAMWVFIHIFNAFALWYLVTTCYESFSESPLVTTLHDTIYPTRMIPFPAVSVCSNNRISRVEAEKFAAQLSSNDPDNKDAEYFLKQIIYFGRVYDFETDNEHLMTAFQQFFDEVAVNIKNENKSSSLKDTISFEGVITKLTPKCEDLILKCFFKSQPYKCMQKYEMLEQRRTSYGYCCSFNFIHRNDPNPLNRPYYSDVTGKDMGLILLVNQSRNDYFYNIFNNIGFTVLIHGHDEYPDPLTGSAVEAIVHPGEESFIRVEAWNIHSQEDILSYAPSQRECIFSNELPQFNNRYTRSDCFLQCKIRSIQALCDCLPFNIPPISISPNNDIKICTLEHVSCLNKYKGELIHN